MKKPLWYISGSVSDDCDFRRKFDKAEKVLTKKGYKVLNPVKDEKDGRNWSYYMRRDIRKLSKCDGIILLEDWYKSKGAQLELHIAIQLELPVLKYIEKTGKVIYVDMVTGENA